MRNRRNSILVSILLSFLFILAHSQTIDIQTDIGHLKKHFSDEMPKQAKRGWIYNTDTTAKSHLNPLGYILGASLYLYQNTISKHLSADCLFTPGCSEFSKQSIRELGIFKGILVSIDRVNRCNRIAEHDLKNFSRDQVTNRYSDPVSRYKRQMTH